MTDPFPIRRRPAFLVALALAGVAALYAAAWFAFAAHVRGVAEAWLDDGLAKPARLSCPKLVLGGFPGAVEIACAEPRGTAPGWTWRGPELRVRIAPWSPDAWPFTAPGTHRFEGPDGPVTLTAKALSGVIEPAGDGAVFVDIRDARFAAPGATWTAAEASVRLSADRRADPPVALAFDAALSSVVLPGALARASHLGDTIGKAAARGAVTGPLAPTGWPPRAVELAQWRDAGGVVQIYRFVFEQGALALSGDGTAALDNLLQPEAAFAIAVAGYDEALNALAARGVVEPRDAAMIGFVLGALSEVPDGGGRRVVKAPLSVQDGAVFIGPVRLMRLTPVRWPE